MECLLADGARLRRLQYDGVDLLTTPPAVFRPPSRDYGRYETRPVYGYDDCFPTVDPCDDWPDHGELCWLPWRGSIKECSVHSEKWPVVFTRRLTFGERSLLWSFAAANHGDQPLAAQHVMHALMPLDQITATDLALPEVPPGKYEMLFLPATGQFTLTFRAGLRLRVTFDPKLFPTVGVWLNNNGYPDEDGCRRCECAFEPTPGKTSRLSDGTTMILPPRGELTWQVKWEIEPCR